jgi:hypothetical protein
VFIASESLYHLDIAPVYCLVKLLNFFIGPLCHFEWPFIRSSFRCRRFHIQALKRQVHSSQKFVNIFHPGQNDVERIVHIK